MMIVSDIGGTYVRIAKVVDGKPQDIEKYEASDFKNLGEALAQYCPDHSEDQKGELLIAAAGAGNDDTWTITNNPDWSLEAVGWDLKLMLNDFEATAHSLSVVNVKTLKNANPINNDLCVIGVGTGLGLAYNRGGHVQKTHGGHMPISAVTDEQWDAVRAFREQKQKPVIFEDIVSGQNDFAKTNPKLFHEFLGLFAAQSIIHGHAYGGVYLTGGVIEGLINDNKFDFETFNAALCFDAVDCVKDDIAGTPIHIITDPYPALKGLLNARNKS